MVYKMPGAMVRMDKDRTSHNARVELNVGPSLTFKNSKGPKVKKAGARVSPYLGALDQKDLQIVRLTEMNEQLTKRCSQLTAALSNYVPINSNAFAEASEGSNVPEVPGNFLPSVKSKNLFSQRSNSVMNANSTQQRPVEQNTMYSTKWATMNLKSTQNSNVYDAAQIIKPKS